MSPKLYKTSQKTKLTILQKAIELFNQNGTGSVTMNALADFVGMSAGNLQYHYKNKEEMIRAILEVMFARFDEIHQPRATPYTIETLRTTLRLHFNLVWEYRFFYRELAVLLRNDTLLASRFRSIQTHRIEQQEALLKKLMGMDGTHRTLNPSELRNVILIGWVLGNTWLAYSESTGQTIDDNALEQAVEIMVQHYKPYLQELR